MGVSGWIRCGYLKGEGTIACSRILFTFCEDKEFLPSIKMTKQDLEEIERKVSYLVYDC